MSPHARYWGIPAPGEDLYCCPECGHLWEDEQNAHYGSCKLFVMGEETDGAEESEEPVVGEIAVAANW